MHSKGRTAVGSLIRALSAGKGPCGVKMSRMVCETPKGRDKDGQRVARFKGSKFKGSGVEGIKGKMRREDFRFEISEPVR